MKYSWQIKDLVDLEYFLKLKFGSASEETASDETAFDRAAFLSFPEHEQWRDEPSRRRSLMRHWLEKRRQLQRQDEQRAMAMPGDLFAEAMRISRLLLAFAALVFGALFTWGLLGYQGKAPVNVFTCLWVLVVPQVFLLLILGMSAVLVRTRVKPFNLGYPVVAALVQWLIVKIGRLAEGPLGAARKNRLREAYGLLGKTKTIYGSVFFWPVFILVQLLGVFLNLGILAALFLKVAITDLAFGWQTTLRVSPETLLWFVEIVARPWLWLFSPPVAHPTLAQIGGTKMVLKDGMVHLATADLVAWWPFIFLTVFFYAFLPRLALAGAGLFFYRRAISAVDFAQGACDRLILRMTTPRLDTGGAPCLTDNSGGFVSVQQNRPYPSYPKTGQRSVAMSAIVLASEDIVDRINQAELEKKLRDLLGMRLLTVIPMETEPPADSRRLRQALLDKQDAGGSLRIVVVQEAWQPPIKESLSWIKSLRAAAGGTAGMVIALIGKPGEDTILTPPSRGDREVWGQAVNSLGDAFLRVESFGSDIR